MQPLVGCWRIDEYLADGILALYGVCRGILAYLRLHLLPADSLTGTGSCHEGSADVNMYFSFIMFLYF